jgi:hypothetical protein
MLKQLAATQIFVAPDGDIKFEVGELPLNNESTIDVINNHLSAATCSNHQSDILEVASKKSGT